MDIAERFPVVADVKISLGISTTIIKSSPISGFLQIIRLPLAISLSADAI